MTDNQMMTINDTDSKQHYPSRQAITHTVWALLLILSMMLLQGCGKPATINTDIASTPPTSLEPKPLSAEELLAEAARSTPEKSEALKLLAARELINAEDFLTAQDILGELDVSQLNDDSRLTAIAIAAELAADMEQPEKVLTLLTTNAMGLFNTQNITPATQIHFGQLRANAYAAIHNHLADARERMFYHELLEDDTGKQDNNNRIWQALMSLPKETIDTLLLNSQYDNLIGWLELARVGKVLRGNLNRQSREMETWSARWPAHPANVQMPQAMQLIRQASLEKPEQIALMLPMQGRYASASQAIINGFMTAFYQDQQELNNERPQLRFYDTTEDIDVLTLYQRAVDDGADVVIGPLDKTRVDRFVAQKELPVPVLALNYSTQSTLEAPYLFFQFGLSADDEAAVAASHAILDGHTRAVALVPESEWGERALDAFNDTWTRHGNELVGYQKLAKPETFSKTVANLMNIPLSQGRMRELRRLTGRHIEFIPRRRQDIDMLFLLALPQQARQIKPLLNFHFAKDIPIYATSHIYSGTPRPQKDRDINGIRFSDIPFLLDDEHELRLALQQTWPKNNSRFYRLNAMGIDAYQLHAVLGLLSQIPDLSIDGASGTLRLQPGQRITRTLSWARIVNGQPQQLADAQAVFELENLQALKDLQEHKDDQAAGAPSEALAPSIETNEQPSAQPPTLNSIDE